VKYIIISILILFSLSAYGQIEDTPLFVGKYFGNQSGGGSGYWQVTGNFTDETGYYDATSIQVGDVLFFVDAGIGYHLPVTSIISASGSSFTVRVNNDGITGVSAVPNGAGGFYRANSPKGLWPDPAGLTAPDRQTLNSFLIKRINQEPVKRDTFITVPHSTNFIPSLVVTNASRFYNNVYISAKGGTDTSTVAFLAAPNTSHYGVVYNIKADSGLVETRILSDAHLSNTKSSYLLRRGQMAQVRALPDQVQANAYKWAVNVSWDSTVVSGGGGVSDGDKGDITVSSSGATWTIDNGVVTSAKVASQTLDSTDLKNRGTTLLKLAQSGATNGQVPKFNATTGNWEPGTDNNSGDLVSNVITETVIEAIGSPSNRSDMPSCIRLNGDTLLLMYEQFPEGSGDFDNYYLVKRYSYDNGVTWQARQNVFATTPLPEIDRGFGIPSLLQRNDTTHLVFWGGRNYPGDPGGSYYDAKIYYTRSTNKGVTWTTPIKIQGNSDTTYNSPGADKLTRLASGRLLYTTGVMQGTEPGSGGDYSLYRGYSDDNGTTWTYGNMGITTPSDFAGESGVFQLRNGLVICTFRTREKWIYASESTDNGVTWGTSYPVLPSGNTMHAMKYVPELDAVIAVYNLAPFDANGAWIQTQLAERANMAFSISRDIKSWSNPVNISNYATTSIVRIEPSFFYDGNNLQVFFSPSDNGASNYGLNQVTIQFPKLIGTELQKRTDYLFSDAIAAGILSGANAKPTARFDAVRTNDAGGTVDYDFRARNLGGDEVRIWDNTTGTNTGNELLMYAKQVGSTNRFRVTANNVTNLIPALNLVFDKANGGSVMASDDLMLNISDGGSGGKFKFYGNGDLNIAGNITEGTPRSSLTVSPFGTSGYLQITGANNGASGGFTRFGLATSAANTYAPFMQSLPIGNYSTEWNFRQTSSSSTTSPLVFNFQTAGGSAVSGSYLLDLKNNGSSKFAFNSDGSFIINSTVSLLYGTSAPEGSVSASAGSMYCRTTGGNGTTFYVKQSGGATSSGWGALASDGSILTSFAVSPSTTSGFFSINGSTSGASASSGYTRFGIGTSSANTYYPYMQSQPFGNYSTEWQFRQTTSSTSTPPLIFDFVKGAGGALDANAIMQRWASNGSTRMTVDQEGDLTANSFVGLLRPPAGTATASTAPLKFTSGTNLTTAEAGAVEYDGTEFYATNSTASRTILTRVLKGSATLDFGSTAAGASTDLTITVTGAADGDVVSLGVPNASVTATGRYFAWVSSANTITVRFSPTILVGSEDPASGTFKVTVTK